MFDNRVFQELWLRATQALGDCKRGDLIRLATQTDQGGLLLLLRREDESFFLKANSGDSKIFTLNYLALSLLEIIYEKDPEWNAAIREFHGINPPEEFVVSVPETAAKDSAQAPQSSPPRDSEWCDGIGR